MESTFHAVWDVQKDNYALQENDGRLEAGENAGLVQVHVMNYNKRFYVFRYGCSSYSLIRSGEAAGGVS